jgi:hypothetical protein
LVKESGVRTSEEFLLFFAFLLPLLILVGQIISQLRNLPKTFRVAEMMIATSLIATALAALGPWSMIVVGLALATWVSIVCASTRGGRWVSLLVGTWLTAITSLMMLAIPPARAMAVKMQSSGNLKQIALAMHNYNDTYGSFPPPFLADDQGVPQHSWRVLLLPYFEEQALYQQYDLDEPWNGPNNRQLLPLMPRIFTAPTAIGRKAAAEYRSSYVVIIDPAGAMPGATSRRWSDFSRQQAETTILAVEAAGHLPLWMEPSDLETDEAIRSYIENYPGTTGGHRIQGLVRDISAGWYAAMVDGSVRWNNWEVSEGPWRALVKHAEDSDLARAALDQHGSASPRTYWNRPLTLCGFAIAYLFALRSAWRRCVMRQRTAARPSDPESRPSAGLTNQ